MPRRVLVNAIYGEESRIAIVEDDRLLELEVERAEHAPLKGNIYKAPITRVEPSLQAAFLDIGSSRNGFLQINDLNQGYWPTPDEDERSGGGDSRGRGNRWHIQDALRPGMELVVQVVKDERALKGATLTTNISLPGRYLVLMIGNQRGGVSRKIVDEGQRHRLKRAIGGLKVPAGMGIIVRTAGINREAEELQRDLDSLIDTWVNIVDRSFQPGSPVALYEESDLATRFLRDNLTSHINEIVVDERATYERVKQFVEKIAPNEPIAVTYFDKPQPIFGYYHVDSQVEQTERSEVTLPSGGSIVINSTEAIVAIDVNSGRATGQADVEETAFLTNQEAAEVIAQQLRLRDLGGLIVIDFIDMNDRRHKSSVERTLKEAVRMDRAKVEIGKISKFGLLELSRQRLKSSISMHSYLTCPHCEGRARVKAPEAAALEVLRKIQSAAFAGGIEEIRVRMSAVAALMLLNQKRQELTRFENEGRTKIIIIADGRLRPEEYQLEVKTSGKAEDSVFSNNLRGQSQESSGGGQNRYQGRSGGDRGGDRGGRRNSRRRNNNNRRYRNDRQSDEGDQSRDGGGDQPQSGGPVERVAAPETVE